MRARPEPIQLEHLSDASFLGKLLVLPANVRLDWKVIAWYKHPSLFGLIVSNEGKIFITSTPGLNPPIRCHDDQTFFGRNVSDEIAADRVPGFRHAQVEMS